MAYLLSIFKKTKTRKFIVTHKKTTQDAMNFLLGVNLINQQQKVSS